MIRNILGIFTPKINRMKKYVINLDERPDRWTYVQEELKRVGIKNYERFPAIKAANGHNGCTASHFSLLNKAPKNAVFAVFEDDVLFYDGWRDTLLKAMRQLPKDWDALWLGSTLTEDLERYSDNLFRLKKGWTSHAIIWNNQNGIIDYILNNNQEAYKIDVYYTTVQEKFNCFVTYPMAATQQGGYSDIIRKFTDYQMIQDGYDKHTKS